MPNPDYRHIAIVLDRSGSMSSKREDTEGGLAEFLADQAALPGRATVSLYHFSHIYECVYEMVDVTKAPDYKMTPMGMTALLDAVGRTIGTTGVQLAAMPEHERPGAVLCVILTDGLENSSTDYGLEQIREMITHQRDVYSWQFVFLGADQDAFAAAGGIGIDRGSALNYGGRKSREAFRSLSSMSRRARKSGTYEFTEAERKDAAE